MKYIRKIHAFFFGKKVEMKNKNNGVKIRDYGRSVIGIHSKSIVGKGILKLNPNAVSSSEKMKLRIDGGGILNVDGIVSLFTNTNIHIGSNAVLSIGDGTYINEGTLISIKNNCIIGANCAISNDVSIMDSDFHIIIDGTMKEESGVRIGNHVWIGKGATILKNVSIGDNCIVGANCLVTQNVPPNSMVIGNPGVVIKQNINWK